jgi:hypothetical protein
VPIFLSIAREQHEPRFRAKLHTAQGGPAIFIQARKSGSVAAAKEIAEQTFGLIAWEEPGAGWSDLTRAVAKLG